MLRIANPQSLNRLGHFLTADYKSAERLAGSGGSNPAGRPKILFYSDLAKFSLYYFAKSQFFNTDLAK